MDVCLICEDMGLRDNGEACEYCSHGNPCLGCSGYDFTIHGCSIDGACAPPEYHPEYVPS